MDLPSSFEALNGCDSVLNTNSLREMCSGSSRVKYLRNAGSQLCSDADKKELDPQVLHHLGEEEFSVVHTVAGNDDRIIYIKDTAHPPPPLGTSRNLR